MKILFYTFVCFIISFTCAAQEKVSFPNFTLELPEGAKKISKDEAISHITNKLDKNKALLSSVNSRIKTNLYVYNDVLIRLVSNTNPNSKKGEVDLSTMKKGFDELFRGAENYHSEIIKGTHISTLIIQYSFGNILFNRFYSYNKDFTEATSGSVEYNRSNESNGKSTFNMIVKTLKFSK